MRDNNLQYLIEKSKGVKMTPAEAERQRRSFAFGNTNIENDRVTRRVVDEQAEKIGSAKAGS
ncbi:MAG: hypothetical protein HYX38_26805 [Rhodospirillales bacterium]|nr:hypothetical protein [Rhodospirillales bacterium]